MYNFLSRMIQAGFLDGVQFGRRLKYGKRSKRIRRLRDNSELSCRGIEERPRRNYSTPEQNICME